ncbi:hypothetical protein VB002_13930 [Campylobacter concisus]
MQNQNDFSELSVPKEHQAHSFFVFFKVIFIPLAIYILAILAYLGIIKFQMKLHTIVMMGIILFVAFIFSRHSALVAYSNFLANAKDYKIRLKEFIIAHLFEISSVKKANAKFEDFFESYTRNFRNDNLANIGQAVFPMLGILAHLSVSLSLCQALAQALQMDLKRDRYTAKRRGYGILCIDLRHIFSALVDVF